MVQPVLARAVAEGVVERDLPPRIPGQSTHVAAALQLAHVRYAPTVTSVRSMQTAPTTRPVTVPPGTYTIPFGQVPGGTGRGVAITGWVRAAPAPQTAASAHAHWRIAAAHS